MAGSAEHLGSVMPHSDSLDSSVIVTPSFPISDHCKQGLIGGLPLAVVKSHLNLKGMQGMPIANFKDVEYDQYFCLPH